MSEDPLLTGIHHVQIAMPSGGEDAARGFYRDVLGLVEQPKPPELAKRGGCWFENGAVRIHLGVDEGFTPASKAHPGLLVQRLKPIVEKCRIGGLQVGSTEPLDGYDRIYVTDPFGNRIELLERREVPAQSTRPSGSVRSSAVAPREYAPPRSSREYWQVLGRAAFGGFWVTFAVHRLWPGPEFTHSWLWAGLGAAFAVYYIRQAAQRLRALTGESS